MFRNNYHAPLRITSKHGETLTDLQWARRWLGIMAQENLRTFSATAGTAFSDADREIIERAVLEYARMLTTRKGFQFPAQTAMKRDARPDGIRTHVPE